MLCFCSRRQCCLEGPEVLHALLPNMQGMALFD